MKYSRTSGGMSAWLRRAQVKALPRQVLARPQEPDARQQEEAGAMLKQEGPSTDEVTSCYGRLNDGDK